MSGSSSSEPTRETPPSVLPSPMTYRSSQCGSLLEPHFLRETRITRDVGLLPKIMKGCYDQEIDSIELFQVNAEFGRIKTLFEQTGKPWMHLKSVARINNPFLEAFYELKKLELKLTNGNLQELELFHGTPSVNLQGINRENLNYRNCGTGVGCRFGKGISFTPFSSYASHYCNKNEEKKEMYLCKVLKGKSHVGSSGLVLPREGYDTTQKPNGHVLVKFHDDVYFPQYLISLVKTSRVKKSVVKKSFVSSSTYDDYDYDYDLFGYDSDSYGGYDSDSFGGYDYDSY